MPNTAETNTSNKGYFAWSRYRGVAFYIVGYPQIWEPYTCLATDDEGNEYEEETNEGEWVDDLDCGKVLAVMVGDDYRHNIDRDDLIPLAREEFCGECGQVGCCHDGLDRESE